MSNNYETYIRNMVLLSDYAMRDIAEMASDFAEKCLREMGAPDALATLVSQSSWLFMLAARRGPMGKEDQAAEVAIAVTSIFESIYALGGQLSNECMQFCPDEDVLKCNPKSDYLSKVLEQKKRGKDGSNSDLPESS